MDVELPEIVVAMLSGQGRERDVATYRACLMACKWLDAYMPAEFRAENAFSEDKGRRVSLLGAALATKRSIEDARDFAVNNPVVFGQYRSAVTEFEAQEASKLQMVMWCLRELTRLRELPEAKTPAFDALITKLLDLLEKGWKARMDKLPWRPGDDYRAWAARGGRHRAKGLMPDSWRWV